MDLHFIAIWSSASCSKDTLTTTDPPITQSPPPRTTKLPSLWRHRWLLLRFIISTGTVFHLCQETNGCMTSHHHPGWPWAERAGRTCPERSPSLNAPKRSCRQERDNIHQQVLCVCYAVAEGAGVSFSGGIEGWLLKYFTFYSTIVFWQLFCDSTASC